METDAGRKKKALAYLEKNPAAGVKPTAKRFRVPRRWVDAVKREMAAGQKKVELTGAVDASEFIAKYDVPKQIAHHLEQLAGKLISDADFRQSLSVDAARWARAKEREQFIPYQIKVREKLYWGLPDTLDELRAKLDVV